VVRKECAPGLGGRFPTTDHVLRDRRFGQIESQFQQFPVNAWRAPSRVGEIYQLMEFSVGIGEDFTSETSAVYQGRSNSQACP
jgi:hypothetical protein